MPRVKQEKKDEETTKKIKVKEEKTDNRKRKHVDDNSDEPATKVSVKQEKVESKGLSLAEAARNGSLLKIDGSPGKLEAPKKLLSFKDQVSPQASALQRSGSSLLSSLIAPKAAPASNVFRINKAAANKKVVAATPNHKKERVPKEKYKKNTDRPDRKKFAKDDRFVQVQGVFSQGVADNEIKKNEGLSRSFSSGQGGGGGGSGRTATRRVPKKNLAIFDDEKEVDSDENLGEDPDIPVMIGSLRKIPKAEPVPKVESGETSSVNSTTAGVNVALSASEIKKEKLENVKTESGPAESRTNSAAFTLLELPVKLPVELPNEKGQMRELGDLELCDGLLRMNIAGSVLHVLPGQKKRYPIELAVLELLDSSTRHGTLMKLGNISNHCALVPDCLVPPPDPSDEPEPA